jgi:hypothetical protein
MVKQQILCCTWTTDFFERKHMELNPETTKFDMVGQGGAYVE